MNCCYICQAEAVSRCYTCGQLICAQHGGDSCDRCNTAVVAGDPRPVHVSSEPLGGNDVKPGWWRPQPAEEYTPPACHVCQALARAVCQNCQGHYCREHAGRGGLCVDCARSARLGLIIFVIAIGLLIGLIILGRFVNY